MSDRTLFSFIDGPMAGKSLSTDRAPIMLRLAFNGTSGRSLNTEDATLHNERAFAYIMVGSASFGFWDGRDATTGRRIGGQMVTATYRLLDPQPPREVLDAIGTWAPWCDANKADLMAQYEKSKADEREPKGGE